MQNIVISYRFHSPAGNLRDCRLWTVNEVPVYDTFIKGAKKGFLTVIKIMPTLVGLMVAVGILRASGFLELIANGIGEIYGQNRFSGRAGSAYSGKNGYSSSAATGLFAGHFLKNMEQIRISDGLHRSVCRVRRRSFIP